MTKPSKQSVPPKVRVDAEELRRRTTIRAAMRAAGKTVSGWAREHGFSAAVVEAVLAGRLVGSSGEAHRICVALHLKSAATFDPAAALREAA